jgi:hypothetical protein
MAVDINGDGLIALGGTSTTQGRLRLAEDTDNGTNYVELTATASVASNRTVTFPDANIDFTTGLGAAQGGTGLTSAGTAGNVLTSNGSAWVSQAAAGGKVLQVVQSTNSTQVTTTSTSYQSSGLTASITPASASNKILIWARTVARHDNNLVIVTIFRGTTSGTNLGNGNAGMSSAYGNGGIIYVDCSNVYLDSPNTTSSQTYTLAYRSNNGGTAYAQEGNSMAVMVLMEIAA